VANISPKKKNCYYRADDATAIAARDGLVVS